MERKIGEIFEYNGEWYQCLELPDGKCTHCDMNFGRKCPIPIKECIAVYRIDKTNVIFKKLEKTGEPYEYDGHLFQSYRTFEVPIFTENYETIRPLNDNLKISVEIKQTKEDMEEKKTNFVEAIDALCKRYNMSDGVRADFMSELKEIIKDTEKCNLKPFDLEAAKAGKPVCTRDGRKARIICFDRNDNKPIVALITTDNREDLTEYYCDGRISYYNSENNDLMMLPEKKEGWVNVYKDSVYDTKDEALNRISKYRGYIDTVKINLEE